MIDKIQVWRAVQGSHLVIEYWEDEIIIYHSLAGETHQIDSFSASVLEQIINNSCTKEALFKSICSLYPLESNLKIKQLLAQVISNFDQIGLIEPQY